MSPYIVTTKSPYGGPANRLVPRSRRAVATLDEARVAVLDALDPHDPHTKQPAITLPESGGTITLPDGTVIEVEEADWMTLGARTVSPRGAVRQQLIDAFNEAQS